MFALKQVSGQVLGQQAAMDALRVLCLLLALTVFVPYASANRHLMQTVGEVDSITA